MITVIDAPCGYGKTTYVIKYMQDNPKMKFIYITPYLNECERILDAVPNTMTPVPGPRGKYGDFFDAILFGKSIVTTHALFTVCHKDITPFLEKQNYTLILDEVLNVVDIVDTKKDDMTTLLNAGCITLDEDNRIIWQDFHCDTRYNDIKYFCLYHNAYLIDNSIVIWTFPVEIFKAFKNTIICTYLFDCQIQRFYYDFFGLKFEKVGINKDTGNIAPYRTLLPDLDKIHILENDPLNNIGERKNALSKTWYKNKKKSELTKIGDNMYTFFRHRCGVKENDAIWTVFKGVETKSYVNGYWGAFLASNARATNNYKDRHCIAYPINKFINPCIEKFFQMKDIYMSHETFAVSEAIQFIYRGAIRQGEDIKVYMPSSRMRSLIYNIEHILHLI